MPNVPRILLFCFLFFSASDSSAQASERVITLFPEAAREDLRIATDLILQTHPAPYRYTSEDDFQDLISRVYDSLELPVTIAHFRRSLLPIFHALGDGGCQLVQPKVPAGAALLPLKVVVQGNEVFVSKEMKGFRSMPSGSRILSINGMPIAEIVAAIAPHVVTDGGNQTFRDERIAANWPLFVYHYVDASPRFNLRYIGPDGTTEEAMIMGMTQSEIEVSQKPSGIALSPWNSTLHPDQDALWLTLESLDPEVLEAADLDPEKYLKALRKEMHRKHVRHLVIDVRNTTGKDLAVAELVFSFIARQEFRVVQNMSVRSLAFPPHRAHTTSDVGFYSSFVKPFLTENKGTWSVLPNDPRLEFIPPAKKTYDGKVHVVCNGGTREAAAALVMLAKRTQRARIIGEEVGSNAHSFNGGRYLEVSLPNSGLNFSIPLVCYVPDGTVSGPVDRGEMPHHTVVPVASDLAKGRDTVKAALLHLFNELR